MFGGEPGVALAIVRFTLVVVTVAERAFVAVQMRAAEVPEA